MKQDYQKFRLTGVINEKSESNGITNSKLSKLVNQDTSIDKKHL